MHARGLDVAGFNQTLAHIGACEQIVGIGVQGLLVIPHSQLSAARLSVGKAEIGQDAAFRLIRHGRKHMERIVVAPGIGEFPGRFVPCVVIDAAFLCIDAGFGRLVPDLAVLAGSAGLGRLRWRIVGGSG
ncbi:MAG: hypothetical protein RID59_14240, partial [Hoeflea sp.]